MMDFDFLMEPVVFLIDTVFGLYIFAVMLRFLLQWGNADYYNPISQFLVKITHPPLRVLRRVVPSVGRIDSASALLMLALQMLSTFLSATLKGVTIGFSALAVLAFSQLLELALNLFFFAIIVRAILSWFHTGTYNPAVSLLYSFTEPLLKLGRRVLPPMGGIDLSPLVPLIGIQVLKMLLLPPLDQLVRLLA